MNAKTVPMNSASTPNLISARGDTHRAGKRIVWLLAVVGSVASLPEAAKAQTYTVTICEPMNGTVSPSPGPHTYAKGANFPIEAIASSGWVFKQWNHSGGVGVGGFDRASTNAFVNGNGTLCPEFVRGAAVTICAPTNGTISPSPGTHTYKVPSDVYVSAKPNEQYQFLRWNVSGGLTLDNPKGRGTDMHITGDGTLCAEFVVVTYTVTICTPMNGTVSPSPGTYTYEGNSWIWVEATPASGYQFKEWACGGGVYVQARTAAGTLMTPNKGGGTLCPEFELISGGKVAVPNVVGLSQAQATAALTAAGLTVGTITQSQSLSVPAGQVISQSPAAGTPVARGSAVDLVVSTGAQPSGSTPLGPVAHWKLDEGQGAMALDSVGGHFGVLYGNPTWLPSGGKIGGALSFDGADDYVQLPIGLLIGSLTDSTFAAWMNCSGSGDWQRVFDFGSGETVNMFLTPRNGVNGSMRFAITTGGNGNEDQTTALQALPGGWHHVAVAIDAAGRTHTLYLDGQAAATKTATRYTPSSLGNTTQNWLGKSQYPDPYFNGSLDDFRIYDRALTQAQIQTVMSGTVAPAPAAPSAEGLVGHWKLDETAGRVAADSAGTCDGILIGGPVWQPAGGKVGGALKFDGVDDCVVTDSVVDPAAGPFRVLAWVKGGGPGQVILSQDGAAGGTDWLAASPVGRLATALGGASLISSKIVVDDQWHEVGLTWDSGSRTLYVDGVAAATDKLAALVGSAGGMNIGAGKNLDAGTYWSGLIDDVRIYKGAVAPTGK